MRQKQNKIKRKREREREREILADLTSGTCACTIRAIEGEDILGLWSLYEVIVFMCANMYVQLTVCRHPVNAALIYLYVKNVCMYVACMNECMCMSTEQR